jgi:hypothetical protein
MKKRLSYLVAALCLAAAGTASASVSFYEDANFAGREMTVEQTMSNLGNTRFNDRARSAIVNRGQWEVCVDADFGGDCQVLGPGRYPGLGGLTGRVSSVRPLASNTNSDRGYNGRMPEPGRNRAGARATLYEHIDMGGRSMSMRNNAMPNFENTGFNDRASSLRVESGYWMFCSDANFNGECRTFGPGDYSRLPAGFNDRISSGRRISDEYPYSQRPNWR